MSAGVFLAVLFAAFLHASWNALVKTEGDRFQAMFMLSTSQGVMGLGLLLFLPFPQGEVWYWLIASGFIHSAYKVFLTSAYEHGDLSRVYPIARGGAPMIVLLVGGLFLADALAALDYLGVIFIGMGIILMARGIFSHGESRRMLPWALASAVATASYSLVDGMGARIGGDATQFVAWMFAIDGVIFAMLYFVRGGAMPRPLSNWGKGTLAGAASLGAYWIAVWAMTVAPIALVTALRETSILFAIVIGVFLFGERLDQGKVISAALIIFGVVLTRL